MSVAYEWRMTLNFYDNIVKFPFYSHKKERLLKKLYLKKYKNNTGTWSLLIFKDINIALHTRLDYGTYTVCPRSSDLFYIVKFYTNGSLLLGHTVLDANSEHDAHASGKNSNFQK